MMPEELVVVPDGTPFTVELVTQLDSDVSRPGDPFRARVLSPLATVDRQEVVSPGATLWGHVVTVGPAILYLKFDEVKTRWGHGPSPAGKSGERPVDCGRGGPAGRFTIRWRSQAILRSPAPWAGDWRWATVAPFEHGRSTFANPSRRGEPLATPFDGAARGAENPLACTAVSALRTVTPHARSGQPAAISAASAGRPPGAKLGSRSLVFRRPLLLDVELHAAVVLPAFVGVVRVEGRGATIALAESRHLAMPCFTSH